MKQKVLTIFAKLFWFQPKWELHVGYSFSRHSYYIALYSGCFEIFFIPATNMHKAYGIIIYIIYNYILYKRGIIGICATATVKCAILCT